MRIHRPLRAATPAKQPTKPETVRSDRNRRGELNQLAAKRREVRAILECLVISTLKPVRRIGKLDIHARLENVQRYSDDGLSWRGCDRANFAAIHNLDRY